MIKTKRKNILIYSVDLNEDEVISKVGWSYIDYDRDGKVISDKIIQTSKEELIKQAKFNKLENNIKTTMGKSVSIISNKYLRTYGDKNKNNDLVDLCTYDEFMNIIKEMEEEYYKNKK